MTTETRELPILFNDAMVRAILSGAKTQTRRPIKPQPEFACIEGSSERLIASSVESHSRSPFGQPGDVLWVRECFADVNTTEGPALAYRATREIRTWHDFSETFGPDHGAGPSMDYDAYPGDYTMWWSDLLRGEEGHGWRPSIHMPRWASRISLRVKRVWVERVPEANYQDILAEGWPKRANPNLTEECHRDAARDWWMDTWQAIYAKRGLGWDANPWVWCCEFEVVS